MKRRNGKRRRSLDPGQIALLNVALVVPVLLTLAWLKVWSASKGHTINDMENQRSLFVSWGRLLTLQCKTIS
jgi:hypothetical protein